MQDACVPGVECCLGCQGSASVVAEFIDAQVHPDVIGTIAGDNTLLIIPRSQKKTKPILQFLKEKLIEGVQ